MRRIPAIVAATAVFAPLVVASSALPAAASGPSVNVTMISRTGAKVPGLQVLAEDTSSYQLYVGTSGRPLSLPRGQYAVMGDVQAGGTDTLAAQVVNVGGPASVTLDARQGRPVSISLNVPNASGYSRFEAAQICTGNSPMGASVFNATPGALFVVPNSSPKLSFGYLGGWNSAGANYLVAGHRNGGVPTTPSGSATLSGLAKLTIWSRSGTDLDANPDLALQPEPSANTCESGLWGGLGSVSLPNTTVTYVTPGQWAPRLDSSAGGGEMTSTMTMAAGHSYTQLFNGAVWGPKGEIPGTWYHRISFGSTNMIADPYGGVSSFWTTGGTYRLSLNGRLLHQQYLTDYGGMSSFDTYSYRSGWYDLSASVQRSHPGWPVPSWLLSSAVTLQYHFWLNPGINQIAPVYTTRYFPSGLNGANQARHGGVTPVTLVLDQPNYDPANVATPHDPPTSVKVWFSASGSAWKAVTVKRVNGSWIAYVPNPAYGTVSLRSQVTDAQGDSTTETVFRAYGTY